ncbi:MAG: NAD(P)H-hydrate dehydratase [Acidobacteria bacterium]|nr:NAD(P)H-hydrate dehydratase [Acidobacteriota bacterium]
MQKVLTAAEMRDVDRLTTEKYGIPSLILMENAAYAAADVIAEKLGGSVRGKDILILCGKGNNGGDGAALGRVLWNSGAEVYVYLFDKIENTNGDARINFEIVKKISDTGKLFFEDDVNIDIWVQTIGFELAEYDVLVDSMFGTGLERPLSSMYRNLTESYSYYREDEKPLFVSLDIPSGLNSNLNYPIGDNFQADLTVTFTAPKLANVLPPASDFCGELRVAAIGSPSDLIDNSPSQIFLAEKADAANWLKMTRFSPGSYKNKRGNVLMIVGSKNYAGAAVLAGNAAIQTGVGLVTIATSLSAQEAVSSRVFAEVIAHGVSETENGAVSFEAFERIQLLSEKADVVAIGSGLGSDVESTRKLVREVIAERKTPVVIDADGLNSLAPFDLKGSEECPLILTPHEGEFLRLLGTSDKEAIKDRVMAARDFAEKHRVILVLKGERTLIAAPDGKVVINPTGNSGLGKAGNGDNLTGIVTGFVAQGIQAKADIFESVVAAVYIAGRAGDIAAERFGKRVMLASDVRDCLAAAFKEAEEEE